MLKIRRSCDRLIFNMGIPIPGKDGLYNETGPRAWASNYIHSFLWDVITQPCLNFYSWTSVELKLGRGSVFISQSYMDAITYPCPKFSTGLANLRGPFYYHGLVWISNHMPNKLWDKITYPFPNFHGATIEVWEWRSNFIPHFIMDVITYPCWDLS